MRHIPFLVLSVTTLASLLACGGGKISQCNSFVEVVNAAAPEMAAASSGMSGRGDPAAVFAGMQKMADVYGKLEADIGKLEITDEGLKPKVDAFRTAAQEIQKGAAASAAAGKAGNTEEGLKALLSIGKQAAESDKLIGEINAYCQGG